MKVFGINGKRVLRLGWPLIILFLLTLAIIRERMGLMSTQTNPETAVEYGDKLFLAADEDFSKAVQQDSECLIIADSGDEQSRILTEDMEFILDDMRIGYDVYTAGEGKLPKLEEYGRIVLTISDLGLLDEDIITLCDWVHSGGQLMNTGTFINNSFFELLGVKAGILNATDANYTEVYGMRILDDFMLNANQWEFRYPETGKVSLNFSLISECKVYIEELESGVPLLWERKYGEGKFVIMNQVLTGKVNRGLLCAAYSLLGDICAYPVINASAYYIDDFPSPVPLGDGKYITEEYGVNISNFYSNIWWPDILTLEKKYGILHTGLIIEQYSNDVEPPFDRNRSTERFSFFGNMLLNNKGELGFHGYNHMPLCPEGYDYAGLYDEYKQWESTDNMEEAVKELIAFSENIFPDEKFLVYVPPSNVMSEDGREALKAAWSDIKVIASSYFTRAASYSQEFEVAEDGIIETPRITSGCIIDDYMMLAAFSELNFHYVQSHFLHPDDVLDEDRGAALGWGRMFENLSSYTEYISKAAPYIRNLTGSGMGEAVREFDKLSVQRTGNEGTLELKLGGFLDEAYFIVRINEGTPATVTGGTLEHMMGNLYLLHAISDNITINYD